MPPSQEPRPKHKSLADMAEAVEAATDPEQSLLSLTIERYQEEDAQLAEAIRYCAIPRYFDEEIIGVLRGEPEGHETNRRLLDRLVSLTFVLPRGDNYTYHDNVRDMLLREWLTEDSKRTDFNHYNQRLAAFYETQYEAAQEVERDFERVARALKDANAARYAQITSSVETGLVSPLLAALYHHIIRSAQDGLEFFLSKILDYEHAGRLAICQVLLNAGHDYLLRLPPESGQDGPLRWMRYWQARLANRMYRYSEAEDIFRDLLPQTEGDDKLHAWVLSGLGMALQGQDKLRQALEIYDQERASSEDSRVDPYNIPSSYLRLAELHTALGELDQATDVGQAAIQHASQENNLIAQTYAQVLLSNISELRGEWRQAFDAALGALLFVRAHLTDDRTTHRLVVTRFMSLLARRDARLLDTLFAEAECLLGSASHPLERFEHESAYAMALLESRRLAAAGDLLANMRKDYLPYLSGESSITDIDFDMASVFNYQGRWEEANALYDRIIGDAHAKREYSWLQTAALLNRATNNIIGARWAQANANIQEGRKQFDRIGHRILAAYTMVIEAELLSLQGQLTIALRLVENARPILSGAPSTYLADCYAIEGDIYRHQGQWKEARERYRQSADISRSVYDHKSVAKRLGDMATVSGEQGQWKEAEKYTNEASQLWRLLHEFELHEATDEEKLADEKNGYGVQFLFAKDGDKYKHVSQARDAFLLATELVPDNFWYRLNLAYSYAELEQWNQAAGEVEVILNDCHEWLRTPGMDNLLSTYGSNSRT